MKVHVTQYRVIIIDCENNQPDFEETQLFTVIHEELIYAEEVATQYGEQNYVLKIAERAADIDDDFVVEELLQTDVLIIAQDFNTKTLQSYLDKHKSHLKPSLKTFVFVPNRSKNLFLDTDLVIETSMILRFAAHHFTKQLIHHCNSAQRMTTNFDFDEFIYFIDGCKLARLEFASNLSEGNSQLFVDKQLSQAIQNAQPKQSALRILCCFNSPNCSLKGYEGFIYIKEMHEYLMRQANGNKALPDCSCFVSGAYGLSLSSAFELMQLVLFVE